MGERERAPRHTGQPRRSTFLGALVVVALAGCGAAHSDTARSVPARCAYRTVAGVALPDPRCTPGATDGRVSPATAGRTICRPGYASSVRPSVRVTDPLKVALMRAYGAKGSRSGYELDHLIPLEGGGAPADPANLWPQPIAQARLKDAEENVLRREACADPSRLRALQRAIAENWRAARQAGQ